MGHSSSNLHELSHTDQSYNLLISGYLRSLFDELLFSSDDCYVILKSDLPSMLIRLCVDFYCSKLHGNMILWSGTKSAGNRSCNNIQLMKVDNHDTIYKMNIHNLDDNDYPNVNFMEDSFDRTNASYSLISSIRTLPKWVLSKYPSVFGNGGSFFKKQRKINDINQHKKTADKLYNIIFRIGGDIQETDGIQAMNNKMHHHHQCRADLIIFDANITNAHNTNLIEAFYCKIDAYEIPKITETSTVYSYHYNRLIFGYGGFKGNKSRLSYTNRHISNEIFSLNIDTLHYQRYAKLDEAVQGMTLCVNNYRDLMLFGGATSKHTYLLRNEYIRSRNQNTNANAFDCKIHSYSEMQKCVKLSDMKHARFFAGSCALYNDNNKVFVGGGEVGPDHHDDHHSVVEMYDIDQNKWMDVGGKTSKKHAFQPRLWNDVTNNNLLYIAGHSCVNDHVKKLGFVEWIDLRSNRKKWNVMWNDPINRLFGLRKKNHIDKKNWISRSLLI